MKTRAARDQKPTFHLVDDLLNLLSFSHLHVSLTIKFIL